MGGNLNLGLVKLPSLELPHLLIVVRIGLEWVLGWIRPKNRVFAPTRRVRVLNQPWYLSKLVNKEHFVIWSIHLYQ